MTGDEVRRVRKQLHLTQAEFGTQCGVARVTVTRWEAGTLTVGTTAAILIRLLAEQARTPRRKGKRPNESNR
jgi:DNA-binding transcriptional regulator YiaG